MKKVTYTANKIILTTAEEKGIKTSWGGDWKKIIKAEHHGNYFYLITGEWSGYNSSQRRIVHVSLSDFATFEKTPFVGTIEYSDNTTLEVNVIQCDLKKLFDNKLFRRNSYEDLINKLIATDSKFYKVV